MTALTVNNGASTLSALSYAYGDQLNLKGIADGLVAANNNTLTDVRPGESFSFTYNKRNRLSAVTRNSVAYATYGYNALEQLTTRTTTAPGGPTALVAYSYDRDGHLITEAVAATGVKLREYIWLPSNDNNPVDLPLAVIDVATNTLSFVHADHLGRPIRMTDAAKTTVWQATWKPWGEIQTLTSTQTLNLRFPGQYFQIETGHHYNHHRTYDPVTGRYTQPDPLRFVNGPSVYAYAKNSPLMRTDRDGLAVVNGELPNTLIPITPKPNNGNSCKAGNDAETQLALTLKECVFLIQCLIGGENGPRRPPPPRPTNPPIVIIQEDKPK